MSSNIEQAEKFVREHFEVIDATPRPDPLIVEARDWLADIDQAHLIGPYTVRELIDRLYDGGWSEFVRNSTLRAFLEETA
jgi:hypothetical protein